MDKLAFELLEEIFTLACTDGGHTGCSLSLVSKYIRDASRTSRFYSISLVSGSARQLAQFCQCFSTTREAAVGLTPRIRHLCISSAHREVEVKARPKEHEDGEQQGFNEDVSFLFRIVAPHLHTLTLIHGHRPWPQELRLPKITTLSFPLLEELMIVGSGMRYAPTDGILDGGCSDSSPQLPQLVRLHLTFTSSGLRTGLDFQRWAARAPHITHLRISNLDYYSSTVLANLKVFIESDDQEACPFANLQHILMQPCGPPTQLHCLNSYIAHVNYVSMLDRMCQNAKRPLKLVKPEKRTKDTENRFRMAAKREFLDRLNGGSGCWELARSTSRGPEA
ncbi:hypothetical protein C8Q80DRAFT_297665 [Daedaleopsis nitida]|nr:hypothetical protein C8Q80DRAFT_297665 [Daedaleopsis nitida]